MEAYCAACFYLFTNLDCLTFYAVRPGILQSKHICIGSLEAQFYQCVILHNFNIIFRFHHALRLWRFLHACNHKTSLNHLSLALISLNGIIWFILYWMAFLLLAACDRWNGVICSNVMYWLFGLDCCMYFGWVNLLLQHMPSQILSCLTF